MNSKLEIWGGLECTINRTGDTFYDQLQHAGHYDRTNDIPQILELNLKRIRYPILWERHQPSSSSVVDWSDTGKSLDQFRRAGVDVIAGLLHHGSGPAFTDLLDPKFPELFAAYALTVATQFPWIEFYTPINEPLTTARFSGLYGLWYPHHKSDLSFMKILLHQLKATVLAMQAIRRVNPDAKLIQTEDLGKTYSADALQYQASFENERRWLTMDILHGRLNRGHVLWEYLVTTGIEPSALDFFVENPCPIHCIGWNYYVTSERYLDDKTENYPLTMHGGNGIHHYVDVEAVRVHGRPALSQLLREAWDRYTCPMAITETHIACTREEQLRWFTETWNICTHLKTNGVDIRAVTVWAILGSFDWNSLLTVPDGIYESGVFHVRDDKLIPTAMLKMLNALSRDEASHHALLSRSGWWHHRTDIADNERNDEHPSCPLLILTDAVTADYFKQTCGARNIIVEIVNVEDVDDIMSLESLMEEFHPWAIIQTEVDEHVPADSARWKVDVYTEECTIARYTTNGVTLSVRTIDTGLDLVIDEAIGEWLVSGNGHFSSATRAAIPTKTVNVQIAQLAIVFEGMPEDAPLVLERT